MKKLLIYLAFIAIPVFFINTSCQKQQAFKSEDGKVSEDNRNVQAQADEAFSDANQAVSNNATITGRSYQIQGPAAALVQNICGASVDTTLKAQGSLTVKFHKVVYDNLC